MNASLRSTPYIHRSGIDRNTRGSGLSEPPLAMAEYTTSNDGFQTGRPLQATPEAAVKQAPGSFVVRAVGRVWSSFSCVIVMSLTLSPARWIWALRGLKANSLIPRGSGNLNSLILDQNSLFRSLGNSPKKPNGHAGFLPR